MTIQEHHAFANDLAELMRKHGVEAIVGCWFGIPGKGMGVVDMYPRTGFKLEPFVKGITEDMRVRMSALRPGVTPVRTEGIVPGDSEKS